MFGIKYFHCVIWMTLNALRYLMDSTFRKMRKSPLLDGVLTGKREANYP